MDNNTIILLGLVAVLVVVLLFLGCNKREHYRDPVYLNRAKYLYDYYPRANGSIYGELVSLYNGHPYYPKAY